MEIPSNEPWGDDHFEQAVRDAAYFLWENDGRPSGREKEYWFRALETKMRERRCDDDLTVPPPPQRIADAGT
jgi:hypothetical protein